ncbi:MAG: hypothetical protein NZ555_13175 [Geminicoccaceae bacterium]|nr:hypothetical protein [Geminicoccaceae bacterium]
MPMRLLVTTALFGSLASAAAAGPFALGPDELDRVTAGALASPPVVGNAPAPQVVLDPPRNPRDLVRWLRWRIGCSLPGRVCIQG